MKRSFLTLLLLAAAFLAVPAQEPSGAAVSADGAFVRMGNGQVTLSFEKNTGRLVSFRDERFGRELLAGPGACLWDIFLENGARWQPDGPMEVSVESAGAQALSIRWNGNGDVSICARVRLEEDSPLTYWSLSIAGGGSVKPAQVQFPVLSGLRATQGEESLALSTWLGSLIHDPRAKVSQGQPRVAYAWSSPGFLSMQMAALYDQEGRGLYFASNDTLSHTKHFEIGFTATETDWRMTHFPPLDGADFYQIPYEAIVGPFRGDWLTAATMYREWGTRQRWCRESRLHNGLTPRWVRKTDLWIWNRGYSGNVLPEAADLKRRTGRNVSVFWHWWHGCSYDEGFPEYLPPREGRKPFIQAVRKAARKGIHCLVYMNSYQWGNSTRSWKEKGAERYAARRQDGGLYSHAYNVFTGRELTPMCMGTSFWRDHYASLADSAVNHYGVAGIYMDQACTSMRCYAPDHGHPRGGGNYWTTSFHALTEEIRSRCPAVLAGEGSGEDWIPSLDLFLTLENSRERYMGSSDTETIPLYQAVYHDYAITYGSYSSLVYPPYDDLWPEEFRPQNREQSLPDDFNRQFRMEQARAFVWGMQPTLANYHAFLWQEKPQEMAFLRRIAAVRRKALKYLLYGVYTHVPDMGVLPAEEIELSKISIYAGRTGRTVSSERKRVPTLYAGGWKARDGAVAFSFANISDQPYSGSLRFSAGEYGIEGACRVYLITEKGRRRVATCPDGEVLMDLQLDPRDARVVEIVPAG